MRTCTKCGETKSIEDYNRHKGCPGDRELQCKVCNREYRRLYRKRINNLDTKKYEKTINGFVMRVYRNMLSRVRGISPKSHIYEGLPILDKQLFYEWTKNDKDFNELFIIWENSNYDRRLTPSIDRIESSGGYTPGNIQWIPFHVNCSKVTR